MHTYTTSGPQTVTLTVTYDPIPGVTETTTVATESITETTTVATESITVAAPGTPPVAGITLPTDPIVAGQAATFTDATVVNDGTGLTYSWNFGDMTPPSTMPSPMHTYAMEGMYTVTLTVTYDPIPGVTETTTVAMEMVTVTAPAPPMELVQNGTADDFNVTTAPSNTGDNADAFDMTPNSTVVDNSGMTIDSPYRRTAANPNGWRNDALEDWLELNCQNPPGAVNEQPSSTSDGAGDTRGLKLTDCRRIYQLVQVTSGTNYTFSIDTRSEAMNTPMTIYVLNTEIADETADLIPANILGSQVITTDFNTNKDIFTTTTFNFTASSTQIVIYGVPTGTGGAEEVFIDNVSIIAN